MPERVRLARVAALAWLALLACERAEGPAPVAWDRTRCAHCGMLVSDPDFAAQWHARGSEVRHYDDPGCLLVSLSSAGAPPGDRLYFHHRDADRWLSGEQVRFVAAAHTPMGYGLAAVDAGQAPDGIGLAEARERALARDRARRTEPRGNAPR